MKTYFSNRIYKSSLPTEINKLISSSMEAFFNAKCTAYAWGLKDERKVKRPYGKESLHLAVKKHNNTDVYYTNSAIQLANGMRSSQNELKKQYLENDKQKLDQMNKKIVTTKSRLTNMQNLKKSIIKGEVMFPKRLGYGTKLIEGDTVYVKEHRKKKQEWANLYLFEHQHVDTEIKRLKAQIKNIAHRIMRLKEKMEREKNKITSCVLGTKKLFRAQFTNPKYVNNHKRWKCEFTKARQSNMSISGRKDAKFGNFVVMYETKTNTLHWKASNGKAIVIPNVYFRYGQDKIEAYYERQINLSMKEKRKIGQPLSWTLEEHGEYYIIKVNLDLPKKEFMNTGLADGVISIDINADHVALSNLDREGKRLRNSVPNTLEFSLEGKSSEQNKKMFERIAVVICDIANKHNKPIGMEKIENVSQVHLYGNKKANRLMSQFAYKRLINAIEARAEKMGIHVFKINPAYTSQIGKLKYMKQQGLSIHVAASIVIGRRVLGYKEKVPSALRHLSPSKEGSHHWNQWSSLTKNIKDIRWQAFYHATHDKKLGFTEQLKNIAFTIIEEKTIQKILKKAE